MGIEADIEKGLEKLANPGNLLGRSRILGKDFDTLGIPLGEVRNLVSKIYGESEEDGEECVEVSKSLLTSSVYEKKMAGIFLLGNYIKDKDFSDFGVFEELIDTYIDEWSLSDTFAAEVVAPVLVRDWENGKKTINKWSTSENKWIRRCALVSVVKCKEKIEDWEGFAAEILSKVKDEDERIVKKAKNWLKREVE